jgi:predicted dienelactone hydrolase
MMNRRMIYLGLLVIFTLALMIPPQVTIAQDTALPLAKPGPYPVGVQTMTFVDQNRKGRELVTEVWYPAATPPEKQSASAEIATALRDAPSERKGAPYPLILYSHGHGGSRTELIYFAYHLTSHGFVVAAMDHPGDTIYPPFDAVDRPLDILFVLDQFAKLTKGDLAGIIDSEHSGVAGYSEGGLTTLEVTGAQRDPIYHADWCAKYPTAYPRLCMPRADFEKIEAYHAQLYPATKANEPWPPFTDKRIRAVLPLTGGPGPVFGDHGLTVATVPTLLMAGTADTGAPYKWAAAYVYQHLGSKDRYLLSFIGADHLFGYSATTPQKPFILHFATAFFGYYLQGQEGYADYLTAKFVDSLNHPSDQSVAWGVVETK